MQIKEAYLFKKKSDLVMRQAKRGDLSYQYFTG